MIAQLTGQAGSVGLNSVVLDVHGVGYLVHATPRALASVRPGEQATLYTSLVVREDSMTLFGFDSSRDRDTFETLTKVSGVGPRLGLAILSVHPADAVALAANSQDTKAFTQVPGIGPKVAQRLMLELKGKLTPSGEGDAGTVGGEVPAPAADARQEQVIEALSGLGWSEKDATRSLKAALKDDPELAEVPVPVLLRAVLRSIGGGSAGAGAGVGASGAAR